MEEREGGWKEIEGMEKKVNTEYIHTYIRHTYVRICVIIEISIVNR